MAILTQNFITGIRKKLENSWLPVIPSLVVIILQIPIDTYAIRCPCINPGEDVQKIMSRVLSACFVFIPMLILFGITIIKKFEHIKKEVNTRNTKPTKIKNVKTRKQFYWILFVLRDFAIPGLVWVVLAMCIGDVYACMITKVPYQMNQDETCDMVVIDELNRTREFQQNITESEMIGGFIAFGSAVWFALCYVIGEVISGKFEIPQNIEQAGDTTAKVSKSEMEEKLIKGSNEETVDT